MHSFIFKMSRNGGSMWPYWITVFTACLVIARAGYVVFVWNNEVFYHIVHDIGMEKTTEIIAKNMQIVDKPIDVSNAVKYDGTRVGFYMTVDHPTTERLIPAGWNGADTRYLLKVFREKFEDTGISTYDVLILKTNKFEFAIVRGDPDTPPAHVRAAVIDVDDFRQDILEEWHRGHTAWSWFLWPAKVNVLDVVVGWVLSFNMAMILFLAVTFTHDVVEKLLEKKRARPAVHAD